MNSKSQKLDPADLQEYLHGMRQSLLDGYCAPQKIDREQVEASIRQIYIESGRGTPTFTWFSNPRDLHEASRNYPAEEAFRVSQIEDKCGKKIRQILESTISAEDFNDAFTLLWDTLPSREIQSLSWQVRGELAARPAMTFEIDQRKGLDWNISNVIRSEIGNNASIDAIEWASTSLNRLAIAQMAREFFEVRLDEVEKSSLDNLAALARGAHAYIFFDKECLISERPLEFYTDEQFRSHHASGPAIVYEGDFKIFCWRGSRVPETAITCNANLGAIDAAGNVEIRRVLIERYGSQQFLLDTGAEIRQHDKFGSLYVKEVWGDEPIVMVHITNSTAEPDGQFRSYFLRVPPTIRTAREAVAWTFGMTADEYDPLIET
ncbi:MAG: hypothetical protein C0469_11785 [Cyanobacteria bacterium DS2.3.42]|nr:hypothetical protein [Cyanobacteria bacterium DS2.3.42]